MSPRGDPGAMRGWHSTIMTAGTRLKWLGGKSPGPLRPCVFNPSHSSGAWGRVGSKRRLYILEKNTIKGEASTAGQNEVGSNYICFQPASLATVNSLNPFNCWKRQILIRNLLNPPSKTASGYLQAKQSNQEVPPPPASVSSVGKLSSSCVRGAKTESLESLAKTLIGTPRRRRGVENYAFSSGRTCAGLAKRKEARPADRGAVCRWAARTAPGPRTPEAGS